MSRKNPRWHGIRFVALPCDWFFGTVAEYQNLSVAARMVYFCLRAEYLPESRSYPGNNGQIALSYSALMKGSGFSSHTTICKAVKELEEKGWITIPEKGGLFAGPNKYKLTGKHDPLL